MACVAVAIGWSGYFNNILKLCGLELPYWATHPPGADGGIANIPAAIIVLLVTCILIVGVKESARATCGIVLIKLAVIAFFIAVGTSSVDTANWSPFMPFGFAGVGAAAAIVFFAYIGFDAVSTTAEEAKNPQRDLPIGIFASLAICTVLYISVAAILTGLVPYSQIDVHAPVAEGLRMVGFKWGAAIVATGAVAGITSVLVVMMLGQIRVFFAMSRDGLLGPWLSGVHPKFRTPHHATYLTGGILLYMCVIPIAEAAEQTILQRVVPYRTQGRVFGFAQSVEAAASPVSAFLIGPIAQFWLIPYMASDAGKERFGWLLGAGEARGIALVFLLAGAIMLVTVLLALASRPYRQLSRAYASAPPSEASA